MITAKLDTMKAGFFNPDSVAAAADRATGGAMKQVGRFARRGARSQIGRLSKTVAVRPPGKPPRNRTGLLRDSILYSYDLNTQSVVVGPYAFNQRSRNMRAPEFLEQDGTPNSTMTVWRNGERKTYRARPFMKPALDDMLSKNQIPEQWRNAIK